MIQLETQEVGTGRWFPIVSYVPGTDGQRQEAERTAHALRDVFGLYATVTYPTPLTPKEGTP